MKHYETLELWLEYVKNSFENPTVYKDKYEEYPYYEAFCGGIRVASYVDKARTRERFDINHFNNIKSLKEKASLDKNN